MQLICLGNQHATYVQVLITQYIWYYYLIVIGLRQDKRRTTTSYLEKGFRIYGSEYE